MDPAPVGAGGMTTSWSTVATFGTVIVGLVSVLWWWGFRDRESKKPAAEPEPEDEDDDAEPVHQDVPLEHMPADGVFTAESLRPLDGEGLPMCMGVCGKIVNVSASGSIRPGAGYGALWAGRDATYSLATLSLKPEDACKMDFKLEDFSEDQQKALAGWYKHFTTKYPVIGTMKEYDGWDFSNIVELAKEQTPFGLKKDSEVEAEAAPFAPSDGAAAAPAAAGEVDADSSVRNKAAEAVANGEIPKDAQVLRKGCRVQLKDLKSSPDLNGLFGILEDFNKDKGRFVIRLESTGKSMLFLPTNLSVLSS